MKKYDAIIIGFGKGGKTLAADLAKRGQKVAMIESSGKMYGGTCINIGCIPTKCLVHDAENAPVDVEWQEKQAAYLKAIERKDEVTAFLRGKNYHNLADLENVDVYDGTGSFVSPTSVSVKTVDGETVLEAERIFINTGSDTFIPPIPGVENNSKVFTSTSIMDLKELPKHLVIIGGGYIGLEFASIYASFGSKVTVLESGPVFIAREDRDIADSVREAMEGKGVRFVLNARVLEVNGSDVVCADGVSGEKTVLNADAILLATGRRPRIAELNLDAAGVELDGRGAVKVNAHLQTTVPNIYAMGDVKGGLQFTYISLDDYRIVRNHLFGGGDRALTDRDPVSYSVFIDPPMSRIGMSEAEAAEAGLNYKVKKLPVAAIPRARTLNDIRGLFKVIVDADTDLILGCTLFGPDSSEIINTVAVAMKLKQPYTFLRDFIYTHPSMSESLNDLMGI